MTECQACGRPTLNGRYCFDCYITINGYPISPPFIVNDDPFRKAWLGDAEQRAADQGRRLDPEAPKDKFDAKERFQRLGRQYIGDDISSLSKKAQKAITHGRGLRS